MDSPRRSENKSDPQDDGPTPEPELEISADSALAACLAESSPAARQAALAAACADKPELADELRRRYALLEQAGILEEPEHRDESFAALPEQLGDFRILRKLGSGGMGLVFLARQESMQRDVALKLVRPEQLLFGETRARFEREAQTIAKLQHPGIVPVHAFGEADGIPYLAMEFVDGCTLSQALRELPQIPPEQLQGTHLLNVLAGYGKIDNATRSLCDGPWHRVAARIASRIAAALQHAHDCGVVHRDIKPSNIMLTPSGRVMLLDFGLARFEDAADITHSRAEPGSLPYMAPEQLRGERADPHSDTYSLGVTLYEMLALNLPYWDETIEGLRTKIVDAQPSPLRSRNRALSRDAETVCLTAMDPAPARRYARASALADDLRNLLARHPIQARRAGIALRLARLVERRPGATLAVVTLAIAAVATPVAINLGIAAERDRALRLGYAASVNAAGYALASHNSAAAEQHLRRCPPDQRGFEWHHLALKREQSLSLHEAAYGRKVRYLDTGSHYAVRLNDGSIAAFDTETGARIWRAAVRSYTFECSPNRRSIAAIDNGTVRLLDALSGAEREGFTPIAQRASSALFTADGRTLLVGRPGWIAHYDAATGEQLRTTSLPDDARCVEIDAAGRRGLFIYWHPGEPGYDPRTEVIDLGSEPDRAPQRRVLDGKFAANCSAISPDEQTVVIGSGVDGQLKLYDLTDGSLRWTVTAHRGRAVTDVTFSPDGRWLFTSGTDSALQVWNARTGRHLRTMLGHRSRVMSIDVHPSGEQLISTTLQHGARQWRWDAQRALQSDHRSSLSTQDSPVVALRWSDDGKSLTTVADRGQVRRWDAQSGALLGEFRCPERCSTAAFSLDGTQLATISNSNNNALTIWDLRRGIALTTLDASGFQHLAGAVQFSPDGRRVAVDNIARAKLSVWDLDTATKRCTVDHHHCWAMRFSPDGRWLWTGSKNSEVLALDLASTLDSTTPPVARRIPTDGPVSSILFVDRQTVALGEGNDIVIRDTQSAAVQLRMSAHQGAVHALHMSSDGSRLVSASHDGTVRVWRRDDADELLVLRASGRWMYDAAFSPDGTRLAAAGEAGALTVWESQKAEK